MFIKFSVKNAKRDTLVAISFGMHLNFEETQLLLRIAKITILIHATAATEL